VLPQAQVLVDGRKKADGVPMGFVLGADGPNFLEDLPEFHLTSGRLFTPGLHELVASTKCARQLEDFEVGGKRSMPGGDWTVVGQFTMGSSEGICMALTDADTMLSAFGRDSYNTISAASVKPLTGMLDFVTYFIGAIMALAATLGAVNSLYAIVDSRRRELATFLRALRPDSFPE